MNEREPSTGGDRLRAELGRLGVDADDTTVETWAAGVARVLDELGDGVPPRAVPAGPGDVHDTDDSPWTWVADPPLGPTGSGPLDGVRLAVKDLIAVAGRPLRAGSRVRSGAAPEPADAPVVAALRAAGAVLVGTTKLHEFAFGVSGVNAFEGTAANPAAPGRVPGGSSSGSAAAVAAGLADVALGTDTGGSCRIPAACCAVVGYKPTYRAVDADGVFPLAPSLDHVGWLASDVHTARRVAEVLGVLPGPAGSRKAGDTGPQRHRRLGVHRRAVDAADADVREAFEVVAAALRSTGWDLVDVPWPSGEETFAVSTALMFAEAAQVHRASLAEEPMLYGADVRARLVQGRCYDLPAYLRARERQDGLRSRCLRTLRSVTAVIGPTLAVVPPRIDAAGDPAVAARLVANTRLANLTGLPALSVPVPGRDLPVGVHVEAADDGVAFIVAAAVEAALARVR
jgi:Asp-tRNA(Asn)/Glu-tRNA(Gln) amidotransferase A subunit family amidase